MADLRISDLVTASQLKDDDYYEISQSESGTRVSYKATLLAIAVQIATMVDFTSDLNTTSKKITGAINELKQLISLIPQFSIEVVQVLPTEDISDTTIYLVPAEDPEVGNYYEEYIHVNDSWELVGTTAVDLSAYYTKLEVDGLLADKLEAGDFETNQTAPANPITLETKQDGLAKSCVVEMNPIQDLHGYSNPWVGGAGKNKFDVSTITAKRYINASGQPVSSDNWSISDFTKVKSGTNYVLSGVTNAGDVAKHAFYDENQTFISAINSTVMSFTTPSNAKYIRVSMRSETPTSVQLEEGSTATSWTPYENNCPISGRTEASVTRTGKNQCYQVLNGLLSITGNSAIYYPNNDCRSLVFNCKAGTTYIASGITANRCIWGVFNSIPNSGDNAIVFQNLGNSLVAFTPTKDGVCILYVSNSPVDTSNAQVELGSTATAYEPYTAETHTKEFGQTVYGGSLDLLSGKLLIDTAMVDLGTLSWNYNSQYSVFYARIAEKKEGRLNILSDMYKVVDKRFQEMADGEVAGVTNAPGQNDYVNLKDLRYGNVSDLTTGVTGSKLCYELATPITIQLSPEAVTLLKGLNIISTDGDTVRVEFSDIPVGDYSALLDYVKSLEARIQNLES